MDAIAAHKRESIVFTTIDLINEFGIQAVSTREVAKRQNISQGTVFQYFKKKDDLLNAVLNYFSLYDNDIYETTRLKKMQPKEAILFYIDSYLTYYENYPAITAVVQAYDVLRNDPDLGATVREIYNKRIYFMKRLLEEAQVQGVIGREVNIGILTDIMISTCNGICHKWRMNDFNFSLREHTLNAVNMLLNAFESF